MPVFASRGSSFCKPLQLPIDISVGLASGQFGIWLRARQGIQQATKWATGSIYIALGLTTAMTGSRKA